MSDNAPDSDSDERMQSDDEDSESDEPMKLTIKARKDKRSNGNWKVYYERRTFNKEWLDYFPWVEEDPVDNKFAICRACNKRMKAHRGILETHQKTKRHLKQISGSDVVEENKEKTTETAKPQPTASSVGMEAFIGGDDMNLFTESPVDIAHQQVTTLIDKLVEKYHVTKLENLKVQNETMLQLQVERARLRQIEEERKLSRRLQQQEYIREAQETQMKLMQLQHETKISAMEDERDAKLRAVEQELLLARQEYEKKMKLLDAQLSIMK